MNELNKKIEAVLFLKGEPVSETWLAKTLGLGKEAVSSALGDLAGELSGRGIRLVRKDGQAMLATAPECADIVQNITKEEYDAELSKAALETLSVIIYKNGASRDEIDYIRGINSSYILRNLQIKGLIEKSGESGGGKIVYKPSMALLRHLGLENMENMPEYKEASEKLNEFLNSREAGN